MGSLAEEFKQKQNREKIPSATEAAQENLWEYEKLIDPKFFKEERWHLKEIAETLQASIPATMLNLQLSLAEVYARRILAAGETSRSEGDVSVTNSYSKDIPADLMKRIMARRKMKQAVVANEAAKTN